MGLLPGIQAETVDPLRNLRFPPDEEREFRHDHNERGRKHVRYLSLLFGVVSLLLLGRELQQGEYGPSSVAVWISRGVLFGTLFGLTFTGDFYRRRAQQLIVAVLLAIQASIHLGSLVGNTSLRQPHLYFQIVAFGNVEIVAFYTLFTLRLLPAALVGWTAVVGHLLNQSLMMRVEPNLLGYAVQLYLNANLVGMLAGHYAERQARRDFLLRGLLRAEYRRSEDLLLGILPASIAARLKRGEQRIADRFEAVTVLFADLVNFTPLAARRSAEEVVDLLNEIFSAFDRLVADRGLEKIKTVGDGYLVMAGAPHPRADHATVMADLALAMLDELNRIARERDEPLGMRIGIHSGPVVAGVIGRQRFHFDLWGATVNLASRLESHGVPNEIHLSAATAFLLRETHTLDELPPRELKGHGPTSAYRLRGRIASTAAVKTDHSG